MVMSDREQKGLEIAATSKLRRNGRGWTVPSLSGNGDTYTVTPHEQHCTCPDHQVRAVKCKHIFAVEYTIRRENTSVRNGVPSRTTETVKVTYPQNWTAYNAAQTEEKGRFMTILGSLCNGIPQPPQTFGRPRLLLSDMIFASAYKIYSGFSSRRFTWDLRAAYSAGLVSSTPHFNSVSNYLADGSITPILKELIEASGLPLKAVETDFAVDSSGFGTSRFVRWFNKKYGREIDNREWVKVHLMCGVKTNIVTSVDVSGWAANDTTYFTALVEGTAQHFQVAEVSADKAYLSRNNLHTVEALGGTAYIPFKINSTPHQGHHKRDTLWERMWHFYNFNRETFLAHYHKRSNVETTFSMIKGKFGDSVRSKSDTGQVNEVLCKVLCHNICVLIHSFHELGIDPAFCAEIVPAQQLTI